jgi:hypothetical protein
MHIEDMDITAPLTALLAKVDAILTAQGNDPALITRHDKIMLAAQYIEVEAIMGMLTARSAEGVYRL